MIRLKEAGQSPFGFWTSPQGLEKRVDLLAETFTYRVYNGAVQAYGLKNDVWGFEWIGNIDERTCDQCDAGIGRQFRLGQFMPDLPIHVYCRCSYRIISH